MKLLINTILLFFIALHAQAAQTLPPVLSINTQGLQASLHWSKTETAVGYRLFYAPYPFQGADSIRSFDLGISSDFSIKLWQKASFYVAIQSYNIDNKSSEFSNIGFVQIEDRGSQYDSFWKTTIKEISDKQFISDDYLYSQLPNINTCFEGLINPEVNIRSLKILNQIRDLHNLPAIKYDSKSDFETQQSALIQRANNFLDHTPSTSALCYSSKGLEGSKTSNLSLTNSNKDPADDLISLVDDAFNISTVGSVGHRRHLLNPFLQFSSYGQVHGASAIKVFDFSEDNNSSATDIPNFVAFPYLRYPYIFFSDKVSNKQTPWNLSIIENDQSQWSNQHDYFSKSKISVVQKNNQQKLTVHNSQSDIDGTGIPNNLSWMVNQWKYDTWYTVMINHITYQSGEIGSIKYDVFIDYKNFFNVEYPLETNDIKIQNNSLKGSLADIDDKDKFELELSGNVTFTGSSQFSNTAFFIEVYNSDKQLLQASDRPFSLNLPNDIYSLVISSCHHLTCYNGSKQYSVQIKTQ